MTITEEMAKAVAGKINFSELKKFCTEDVKKASSRFDIESVDFYYCEDGYDYERRVNDKYEDFVREACAEEESVSDYFYAIISQLYPEEIESIELDWEELDAITKEIKFKDREGKEYSYEEFGDLIFELGEEGMNYIDEYDIYRVWNDYEEDQKSYGKDNGSGWSPEW